MGWTAEKIGEKYVDLFLIVISLECKTHAVYNAPPDNAMHDIELLAILVFDMLSEILCISNLLQAGFSGYSDKQILQLLDSGW